MLANLTLWELVSSGINGLFCFSISINIFYFYYFHLDNYLRWENILFITSSFWSIIFYNFIKLSFELINFYYFYLILFWSNTFSCLIYSANLVNLPTFRLRLVKKSICFLVIGILNYICLFILPTGIVILIIIVPSSDKTISWNDADKNLNKSTAF